MIFEGKTKLQKRPWRDETPTRLPHSNQILAPTDLKDCTYRSSDLAKTVQGVRFGPLPPHHPGGTMSKKGVSKFQLGMLYGPASEGAPKVWTGRSAIKISFE